MTLDDNSIVWATTDMLGAQSAEIGDYWINQDEVISYLCPKRIFKRIFTEFPATLGA